MYLHCVHSYSCSLLCYALRVKQLLLLYYYFYYMAKCEATYVCVLLVLHCTRTIPPCMICTRISIARFRCKYSFSLLLWVSFLVVVSLLKNLGYLHQVKLKWLQLANCIPASCAENCITIHDE